MPKWWMVSRYCQEFSCVPSVALRDMAVLPYGMLDEIVELRGMARAIEEFDRQDGDVSKLPESVLFEWLQLRQYEQVKRVKTNG